MICKFYFYSFSLFVVIFFVSVFYGGWKIYYEIFLLLRCVCLGLVYAVGYMQDITT